ncbi:1739_t:CDS:2, partial [Ambispora leptoticha]
MNDYVPGTLSQSLLGIQNNKKNKHNSLIDAKLDALFKSSAGPCQIPSPQLPSIILKDEVTSDLHNISDNKDNANIKNRKEINRIDKDKNNNLTIEEKYELTRLKKQNDDNKRRDNKEKEAEKEPSLISSSPSKSSREIDLVAQTINNNEVRSLKRKRSKILKNNNDDKNKPEKRIKTSKEAKKQHALGEKNIEEEKQNSDETSEHDDEDNIFQEGSSRDVDTHDITED